MSSEKYLKGKLTPNIKRAIKANLWPAICLQLFAFGIGLSYFYWPDSQVVFLFFAELKSRYGMLYAIVSTAIFGGVLPFAYLWASGKVKFLPFQQLFFYTVLWGFLGGLINEFYGWQALLFGNGADWITIIKKTAFDQFFFSMLFTCPFITLAYLWKDKGFNWSDTQKELGELVKVKIPTTVLTNWLIWIPAVMLIYTMPANLQLPLFNLVLCFFVLILAILNVDEAA